MQYNRTMDLYLDYNVEENTYNVTSYNALDYSIGKTKFTNGIHLNDLSFNFIGRDSDWHLTVKENSLIKGSTVTIFYSSDQGVKIFETKDGKTHEITVGQLALQLVFDASGTCDLIGLSSKYLDCSKFPIVTFAS
jgi:hypothetical protein